MVINVDLQVDQHKGRCKLKLTTSKGINGQDFVKTQIDALERLN